MDTKTNYHIQPPRKLPKGERRVRFADSMGMELVSIFLIDLMRNYYFVSQKALQAPPPKARTTNNNNCYTTVTKPTTTTTTTTNITNTTTNTATTFNYIREFTQPISLISFKERVRINKVHLETCQINSTASHVSVSCTIRVLNLSYDKSVIVRYTTDDWHTHTECVASYKPGSCDGWSDKFTSTFSVTNQVKSFKAGQRIIFAIKFTSNGGTVFWDNNGGLNYAIKKVNATQ